MIYLNTCLREFKRDLLSSANFSFRRDYTMTNCNTLVRTCIYAYARAPYIATATVSTIYSHKPICIASNVIDSKYNHVNIPSASNAKHTLA